MPTLTINKTYNDGAVLTEVDLDNIKESVETFVNTTGLDDDNIQDNGITASDKLIDATVTTAKLENLAVTAAKLASDAVETAKIKDANVTGAKLATSAADGSTLEVASGSIRIKDAGVTKAKLAALGQQVSSAITSVSVNEGSFADVSGLSVSITTIGRPVFLALISADPLNGIDCYVDSDGSTENTLSIQFIRGSSVVAYFEWRNQLNGRIGVQGNIFHIDTPSAGTYTYKVAAAKATAEGAILSRLKLVAFEL